ncbi:DinB family protein [Rhizobium mongolense]|uniref:DinB family protein n=1 Tax=Rhizobium TaxID=379 RepID=UPI0024B24B0E|nr:DinB family protein [Rhizobium sp. CC1099]WFU86416.1 DinB family protein [Rhizobium sp. CC1099]
MARYNTWQNTSLVTAADGLTKVDRWKDRGAFFQSIAATLNHLYWADALILQRLKGNERPEKNINHPSQAHRIGMSSRRSVCNGTRKSKSGQHDCSTRTSTG